MNFLARCVRMLILLALLMTPIPVLAQEDDAVSVVGSGIVQPLLQALVEASGAEANLNVSVTGTRSGFEQFCAGQAEMTTANRRILTEEGANCGAANVTFFELLLGQEISVFVANSSAAYATCLSGAQLNQIFALSAEGQTSNWNQVIPDADDIPLAVLIPDDGTTTYAILDKVIEGDGIRADAEVMASADDMLQALSADDGAVGVMRLSDAVAAGEAVRILDVNAGEIAACQPPSSENVEDGLYPAADQLYLYVNTASLDKPGFTTLLDFIVGADAAAVVAAQGHSAPSANALQTNAAVLQAAVTGEPIPQVSSEFVVDPGVAGTVLIGGAANAFNFVRSTSDTFTGANTSITISTDVEGEPAGFRRLCNDELDIAISSRDLTDDEMANCTANNLTTLAVDLGRQAVVLVANAGSEYLSCLRTEQIVSVWDAASSGTMTIWNQIDASFPETAMTLFAPDTGTPETDLLFLGAAGQTAISRIDTQINGDPLYRAAATALVEGALTYMTWQDYLQVLDNDQANVQLVAVDGGAGCVTPSLETVSDGSYPLARPALLILNQDSLAKPQVQAFVWYLMSNENFPNLEGSGLLGVRFGELTAIRAGLQQAFGEAELRMLERAAEATPEATVEATAEATPES